MSLYKNNSDKPVTMLNDTVQTAVPDKYELVTQIEDILSYLLSRKHKASVKITFKKEKYINGNINQTRGITKE